MKSLEKQREDNRIECVKNCSSDNGSFCEKHFQIDCEFSRRIGERDMRIDDCPNCADQASIAAPGQTTLCKTHSDEQHYADMKEFFNSQLSNLTIQVHMPFCSRCGKNDPDYIGFIQNAITLSSFSFCIDCRNELTIKKNAAIAAQERIARNANYANFNR